MSLKQQANKMRKVDKLLSEAHSLLIDIYHIREQANGLCLIKNQMYLINMIHSKL